MENEMRQRCYQCFRPRALCFCEAIPRIDNRTEVLILQHVGERYHPFNTARIVDKALRRCHLITDHNQRMGSRQLPIQARAGLLYPRAEAPLLTDVPVAERPSQLLLVDGTWHQAKTMVRDVGQLHDLPCYRLSPSSPGQYRIRREPDAQSLSTLEATVAALQALEPATVGLDQLLSAFQQMVESQLGHPTSHAVWRRRKTRHARLRHFPLPLMKNLESLVVAYGESTPGQRGPRRTAPVPVNWVAQRLGSGERFSCCLRQQTPLANTVLNHMRLSATDFDDAVSQDEFCRRWKLFGRRHDTLIVYHQRTFQLLRQVVTKSPRCLVLKSIFGRWQPHFHGLEELMSIEGVPLPEAEGGNRANQRLEMAVRLVEHVREKRGQEPFWGVR